MIFCETRKRIYFIHNCCENVEGTGAVAIVNNDDDDESGPDGDTDYDDNDNVAGTGANKASINNDTDAKDNDDEDDYHDGYDNCTSYFNYSNNYSNVLWLYFGGNAVLSLAELLMNCNSFGFLERLDSKNDAKSSGYWT